MVSLGLLLLSVVSPAIFLWLSRHFSQQEKVVHALLFGLTSFYELAFVTFPTYYSVFTGFDLEAEISVGSVDLATVLIGHMLFVVMFFLGLTHVKRMQVRVIGYNYWTGPPPVRRLAAIFVGIGLVLILVPVLSPTGGLGSGVTHAEIIRHQSITNMLIYWVTGAFQFPAVVVACYVAVDRVYGKIIRTIGFAIISLWVVHGLVFSLRGHIARVLALTIAFGIQKKRRKLVVASGFLAIFGLSLFSFLRSDMRVQMYRRLYSGSPVEKLGVIAQGFIKGILFKSESAGYSLELLRTLADRAQDVRNSVFLYRLQDRGSGAGGKPLLSALYFPIPRAIWPAKRTPGSMGKTNYESAMHLVRIECGFPYYEMGPFLASAHAYWEGGWLWVILAGFITGILWKVMLRWCNAKGGLVGMVVAVTFAGSLLTNGIPTCLQPLYAFFPTFWSKVLPFLVLAKILNLLGFQWLKPSRNDFTIAPERV